LSFKRALSQPVPPSRPFFSGKVSRERARPLKSDSIYCFSASLLPRQCSAISPEHANGPENKNNDDQVKIKAIESRTKNDSLEKKKVGNIDFATFCLKFLTFAQLVSVKTSLNTMVRFIFNSGKAE